MKAGSEEHKAFMRPKFPEAFELFYAVFEGTTDEVIHRLAMGDNPNAVSIFGTTPIFYATQTSGRLLKADVLFEAGALIDIWSQTTGEHPLHFPFFDPRCILWLLEHNVDPNVSIRPAKENQFYPIGWTALHLAVNKGLLPIVTLLLEHNADVNRKSEDGSTVLHVAARQLIVYKRLIRTLINAGADVNAIAIDGRTPLHEIVARRAKYSMAAARLLLHRGARVDIRDAAGHLPIELITQATPDDPLRVLLQKYHEGKS